MIATRESRLQFETLIADLSARLVVLLSDNVDNEIVRALDAVRRFFQCDRCGLLSFSQDCSRGFVTHISCADGVPPVPGDLNVAENFPWAYEQVFLRGVPNRMNRLEDLPPEAERDRQSWAAQGACSSLDIPLLVGQTTHYVISIQHTAHECEWPEEYVSRLRLLGEVFINALERKKTYETLRESEARLRLATDAAGAGVWSWDSGTGGIWATEKALELYGFSPDEDITFDRFVSVIHPDDRDRVSGAARQAFQEGTDFGFEYRIVLPEGSIRWIKAQAKAFLKPSGEPDRMTGVSIDISQSKQQEGETAELRLELAHLARVMTMNEISTSLAHEINQPLGSILNNASAASLLLPQVENRKGEIGEILTDIIQDTKRAGDIIRKIRGIVRRTDVKFEPLHINAVIEDAIALFRNNINMNKVSLVMDLKPDLPEVRGDRVRLQQVLVNLVTNAMEAMRNTSSRMLTIRSRREASDSITVSVSDTGTGLNRATEDRVFEPFFTTKKDGLGMGLRICQSIIEEHGGRLWAENNPAAGATFSFSLDASRRETP